jgi:hypothetical protein
MKTSVFARALFASAFMLALTPAISMADGNPNCSVNWLNGACGTPTSDGGAHKGAEVQSELREKPCPEHQGKDA